MNDEPYKVGYGKPPLHSRFKKGGPSPHPQGRPKGAKSSSTMVREALIARVPVRENGKRRNVSKLELSLAQLANKAANGDLKAIQLVVSLYREVEADAAARSDDKPLDTADREILDTLLDQLRQARGGGSQ